jgi:pilus assembly protein Flp/PilA
VSQAHRCLRTQFFQTSYTLTEAKVASITLAARKFIRDEEGAALAEYGILVAFIAIVAITAVTFFGSKISSKFSSLANSFS